MSLINWYRTQMCEKAVDFCPFMLGYVPDYYKTKRCAKKLFLKDLLC